MEKKIRNTANTNGNSSKSYHVSAMATGNGGQSNLSSSRTGLMQRLAYTKHSKAVTKQNTTNNFAMPNTSNKETTAKYSPGVVQHMSTRHQQQQNFDSDLLSSQQYPQAHHYQKPQSYSSYYRQLKRQHSLTKSTNSVVNNDNNNSYIANSKNTARSHRRQQSQQVSSRQTPVTKMFYKNVQMMVNKAGSLLSSAHNHNNSTIAATSNNNRVENNNTLTSRPLSVMKSINEQNNTIEQLMAAHNRATSARTRNEEAIIDLKRRIPEIDNIFDIHNRIGNGTFSTVLLGTLIKERDLPDHKKRKFAIKHHVPTSHPDRIMKELQCMAKIGGRNNVVGINCCIRFNESVAFIMPYLAHDRFLDFFKKMDVAEVQFYLKNLLIALRHVHKFHIIHRDVKPSNFLYNRQKRQFLLVDFGLAQQVPQCLLNKDNENVTGNNITDLLKQNQENNACDTQKQRRAGDGGKRLRENDDLTTNNDKGNTGLESSSAKRFRLTTDEKVLSTNQHNNGNEKNATTANASGYVTRSQNKLQIDNQFTTQQQQQQQQQGAQKNRQTGGADSTKKCNCYGNPQVCNICLVKKEIHASRAGTPGYRPPEVLLKYPDQTTAVDIWAVGVIFLSILSTVYPFFKAPNDYVALAEMVTIFGDKVIRKTAFLLDRLVTLSQCTNPLDLRKICIRFRNRLKYSSTELLKIYQNPDGSCEVCKNCDQFYFNCLCKDSKYTTEPPEEGEDIFPDSAYDLLSKLLEINPHKRITAEEALNHPFFMETENNNPKTDNDCSGGGSRCKIHENGQVKMIRNKLASNSVNIKKQDNIIIEISSDSTTGIVTKKTVIRKTGGNYIKKK